MKTYSTQPTKKERGRKRTWGSQWKLCLALRARSPPRDLLAGNRLRCRSAFDSRSLWRGRGTPTVYRQTEWSQYISCIRCRTGCLPCGSGFCAVLHPFNVVVLKYLLVDRCRVHMWSIFWQWGNLGSFGLVMRPQGKTTPLRKFFYEKG